MLSIEVMFVMPFLFTPLDQQTPAEKPHIVRVQINDRRQIGREPAHFIDPFPQYDYPSINATSNQFLKWGTHGYSVCDNLVVLANGSRIWLWKLKGNMKLYLGVSLFRPPTVFWDRKTSLAKNLLFSANESMFLDLYSNNSTYYASL